MKSYVWNQTTATDRQRILRRPDQRAAPEVTAFVRKLFDDVEREGEAALRRWAKQLDGVDPALLELSADVIDAARAQLSREDLEAIDFAVGQVRFYHEATKPKPLLIETLPGARVQQTWRPIATCGLYVPAGTAPLISTLIMLAEPARVAGVRERVVVTSPGRGGAPHPAMIVAADACGLEALWLIGGAQAIAALAFGVWTPKALKVFGPGNVYVAEAKRQAAAMPNGPAIDLPAGPSELMVIADRSANAERVASDLLSQAEHDGDAQVMLVSTSAELINAVEAEVNRQLVGLPRQAVARQSIGGARFILTNSLGEAVDIANSYAPEHLSLQIVEPDLILGSIENAGAVFVGAWSAETFGDYVAGPSHVLPTDAAAKTYAGVGVTSFMKSLTIQDVSEAGAQRLASAAARLARLEGLEAHARAADLRLMKRGRSVEPSVRRRRGEISRETKETKIVARVDLDCTAPVSISTGVGFVDHMLEQVAHHGGFSLTLTCTGDLHIDTHHSIEDCAIAFGQALKEALADRRGIARFGFVLPMDEAEARLSIDLSGRPYLVFDGAFASPTLGAYPTEMTKHFFRSLAENLGATIHVAVTGENDHHKTEACFKALGRALRTAMRVESDVLPTTKGVL